MRNVVLGIALLTSIAAMACGGGNRNTNSGGGEDNSDIVTWSKTMDKDSQLLPAFESQAQKAGCQTNTKDNAVVAKCNEGPIVMLQEGRKITIGCKGISLQECQGLFKRIVDTP